MKKISVLLILATLLAGFTGCGDKTTPVYTGDLLSEIPSVQVERPSDFTLITVQWDYYPTAAELVAASTNVFKGKVQSVSSLIANNKGETDGAQSPANSLLFTVFSIEPEKNYKGTSKGTVALRMPGGVASYYEEQVEQCEENGIPYTVVEDGTKDLTEGQSYLFVTVRSESGYDEIISMNQFVYPLDSPEATAIREACKSGK